jgi:hypothetical protein
MAVLDKSTQHILQLSWHLTPGVLQVTEPNDNQSSQTTSQQRDNFIAAAVVVAAGTLQQPGVLLALVPGMLLPTPAD